MWGLLNGSPLHAFAAVEAGGGTGHPRSLAEGDGSGPLSLRTPCCENHSVIPKSQHSNLEKEGSEELLKRKIPPATHEARSGRGRALDMKQHGASTLKRTSVSPTELKKGNRALSNATYIIGTIKGAGSYGHVKGQGRRVRSQLSRNRERPNRGDQALRVSTLGIEGSGGNTGNRAGDYALKRARSEKKGSIVGGKAGEKRGEVRGISNHKRASLDESPVPTRTRKFPLEGGNSIVSGKIDAQIRA